MVWSQIQTVVCNILFDYQISIEINFFFPQINNITNQFIQKFNFNKKRKEIKKEKRENLKSLVKAKRGQKKGEYKKEKGKDSNNNYNGNRKGRRRRRSREEENIVADTTCLYVKQKDLSQSHFSFKSISFLYKRKNLVAINFMLIFNFFYCQIVSIFDQMYKIQSKSDCTFFFQYMSIVEDLNLKPLRSLQLRFCQTFRSKNSKF